MFRSITAFVLIATLLASNFSRLFVYAGFEMNKEYITAKLCENRDKPRIHCNGKCYLAKKIKQAEQKQKSQERDAQKSHFQEAFITPPFSFKFASQVLVISRYPELAYTLCSRPAQIYHPPKQVA